jgi:hypothetical protein
MKIQISVWALCLLVATVLFLPQAAQAQCTTPPSTLESFIGTFQFNVAGIFNPPFFSYGSGIIEGTITSNGDGTLTNTQTVFGSALFPNALVPSPTVPFSLPPRPQEPVYIGAVNKGTYEMNCDGTMSLVFHDPTTGLYDFQAVLVKGGTGLYLINDDNIFGVVFSGAGEKI